MQQAHTYHTCSVTHALCSSAIDLFEGMSRSTSKYPAGSTGLWLSCPLNMLLSDDNGLKQIFQHWAIEQQKLADGQQH